LTIEFTRAQQGSNPCNLESNLRLIIVHACFSQLDLNLLDRIAETNILKTLNTD
jgi:hypothetical protein